MRSHGGSKRRGTSRVSGGRYGGRLAGLALLIVLLPSAGQGSPPAYGAPHGIAPGGSSATPRSSSPTATSVRLLPGSHIPVWTGGAAHGEAHQVRGWRGGTRDHRGQVVQNGRPGSLVDRPPLHAVPPSGLSARAPLHALPPATARALAQAEQRRVEQFGAGTPRCVVAAESRSRKLQRWQAERTGCLVTEPDGRRGRDRAVD